MEENETELKPSKMQSAKKYAKMILQFAKNDLKKRYSGSLLGIFWAYIQPLIVILVWFVVFEFGLKQHAPLDSNIPFILWLVPAYVGWTYISDTVLQSANVLYEYSYLVKKVKFKIEILPLVKIVSSFLIHLFFIAFTMVLYACYIPSYSGVYFHPTWFQVFYYCFASTCLLTGLSWLVSSLSVFWKDIPHVVNIFLQIGFWMTPVFWDPATFSTGKRGIILKILKFNPAYYIVSGYRDCFIGSVPFYNHLWMTIYFWAFTIVIFFLGLLSFKKLSKHYADLL